MYTRPPCALIRLITSPSGSTYGIRSVRNSPITSPFGVLISSPTMIRTPRSRSVAVTAADVTLWSVTQNHVQGGLPGPLGELLERQHGVAGRGGVQVAIHPHPPGGRPRAGDRPVNRHRSGLGPLLPGQR